MNALTIAVQQELSWQDWMNLRCDLIWIYDAQVEAQHSFVEDFMIAQAALFIRSGGVTIMTEKDSFTAGEGSWVFLNEGRRTQKFVPNSQILSLRFHCAWPGRQPLFDWNGVIESGRFPELEVAAHKIERRIARRFPKAKLELRNAPIRIGDYLEIQRLFLHWLHLYSDALLLSGHIPSRFEIEDPRVLQAIRIIDHHPLEQPFREPEFARQVGLSASQMGKLFLQKFGVSPCQYFERRRFEEAVARVRTTPDSLKSIAMDLGFSSLPHFSSWFRRKAQITPSDLRQTGSGADGKMLT